MRPVGGRGEEKVYCQGKGLWMLCGREKGCSASCHCWKRNWVVRGTWKSWEYRYLHLPKTTISKELYKYQSSAICFHLQWWGRQWKSQETKLPMMAAVGHQSENIPRDSTQPFFIFNRCFWCIVRLLFSFIVLRRPQTLFFWLRKTLINLMKCIHWNVAVETLKNVRDTELCLSSGILLLFKYPLPKQITAQYHSSVTM